MVASNEGSLDSSQKQGALVADSKEKSKKLDTLRRLNAIRQLPAKIKRETVVSIERQREPFTI